MSKLFMLSVGTALLSFIAQPAVAQTAPSTPSRGWVAIDIMGVQSSQDAQSYAYAWPLFREAAAVATEYPALPKAIGGGYSAGVTIAHGVGIGFRGLRAKYEYPVGLGATIPHPFLFGRPGTGSNATEELLTRTDTAYDFQASYTVPTSSAVQLRIFGGPTYFKTDQDMVGAIRYEQLYNLLGMNLVDVTGHVDETETGSGWGVNGGIDVAYFFSRHVGVGGGLLLNRGTVTVTDPLSGDAADLKAGSTTYGAGLRLRF